jgi:hypothetical protein
MVWWLAAALAGDPVDDERPGMVGHFEQATYTMLTVAVGDVRRARKHARELSLRETVPMIVRTEATELNKCKTLDCASVAVGKLARTCAECHVAGGVGPQPSGVDKLPLLPPQKQHAHAAMYMWIGLVTPNEQAFTVGLAGAVPPVDLDSPQALFDELQTFEGLVREAQGLDAWDPRADAFGAMLQRCAGCHALAGLDRRIKAEQKAAEKAK